MKIKHLPWLCLIVVTTWFSAVPAYAEYFDVEDKGLGPIKSRSVIPILYMFYSMQTERAETVGRNKFEFNTHFDAASDFEVTNNGINAVNFDLELYRTSFNFTYGIFDGFDVHLEVPIIAFGNGFLDGFVNSYHDAFGFPNGGRKDYPDDRYGYFVQYNNQVIVSYPSQDLMISDVNLDVKWQVLKDESFWPAIALRSGVKFPTGDDQKAGGSGKYDFSFGFALSKSWSRFHTFGGFNYIFIQDPAALSAFIDEDIYQYYFGGEFALIKHYLSVIVQFEGQNAPYASTGLPQFDNHIFEIVPGFKGEIIKDHLEWQAALREDLIPDSTVDFTASLGLNAKF